jgi:hypothetical protein
LLEGTKPSLLERIPIKANWDALQLLNSSAALLFIVYCGVRANTQSDPPAGTEASRASPENSE